MTIPCQNVLVTGTGHPNIFLNQSEINAIKSRINTEPWKTAYNQFISDANNQLSTPIKSVTYGGTTPPSGDSHDYYSGAPGCTPSDTCRADYMAAIAVSKAVRELGLAYALTNNNQYADKAIQLINGWCVNSATKMNPRWWYSGQNGQVWIELYITMPAMFYGADLIWNYNGWNSSDKTAFKTWVNTLLTNRGHYSVACNSTQNYDSWLVVFGLAASIIADNQSEFDYYINFWKGLPDCQQDTNGSFYRERTRSEGGWAYSMYNLKAWITACEITKHRGIDLYNYKTSSNKGLELGLDYHAPYVVNPDSWPYTKCTSSTCRPIGCTYDSGGAFYELAYKWKQKSAYYNAINDAINNTCSRPRYDNRVMGYVTLTHGI